MVRSEFAGIIDVRPNRFPTFNRIGKVLKKRLAAVRYFASGAAVILALNIAQIFLYESFATTFGIGAALLFAGSGLIHSRRAGRRSLLGMTLEYVGLGAILGFVLAWFRDYGSGIATAVLAVVAVTMLVLGTLSWLQPSMRQWRHWKALAAGVSALLSGVFPVVVWALGVYPIGRFSFLGAAIVGVLSTAVTLSVDRSVTKQTSLTAIDAIRSTALLG